MSGGIVPQQQFLGSPSQLAHLFGFPSPAPAASVQQQRIKLKRSRQRVDAGEPRNSYQATAPLGNTFAAQESAGGGLNGLLPHMQNAWLRLHQHQQQQQNNIEERDELIKEDDDEISEDREPSPSKDCDLENGTDHALDLATASPLNGQVDDRHSEEIQESPKSSKRKSFQPMRQVEHLVNGGVEENDESGKETGVEQEVDDEDGETKEDTENAEEDEEEKQAPPAAAATETTAAPFAGGNKFHELFSNLQQKLNLDYMKTNGITTPNASRPFQMAQPPPAPPLSLSSQPAVNKDYSKLVHSLKQEMINCLSGSIEKVVNEFAQAEAAAAAVAMAAARAAAAQQQQQQQMEARPPPPFFLHPLYHPYAAGNPAGLFASGQTSGIFPAAAAAAAAAAAGGFPFGANSNVASLAASAAAAMRKADDYSPLMPRKKRSKVTDTRLNKLPVSSARDDSSRTPSTRNSPQLSGYFPPTMVGHSLYGSNSAFGNDRDDSPINSDDLSDYGPCDGSMLQSSTHLRKAKLMFFYTRYPNSSLLKSYFPDIHFNKNNTAQLVKWFSNFREFFYIQMEKYARAALADHIRNRDEIVVTTDSEIYKQLNQHYNRNNHIQPPERLCLVIQETLREFFSAIQVGRDTEPSWKKSIYKVISRLDDPIPDYFKDPHFLERLEKP